MEGAGGHEEAASGGRDQSSPSNLKKAGLSFSISFQEAWKHLKAVLTGQIKKAKAKNEKELSEADLLTSKAQVEATDAAENKKKQLGL